MIKTRKNIILYFFLIYLVILEAIKYSSGTDYFFYYYDYQNYFTHQNYQSRYEPLYSIFSKLAVVLKLPYHLFLFIYYFIYYLLIGIVLKKVSPYPIISLLLLFCISIGLMGSNRQLMAAVIVFFTFFTFFINSASFKNYFLFFLSVLIACGFHYSAIVFLPIALFRNRIAYSFWISCLVIAFLFLAFNINSYIIFNIDNFIPQAYSNLINKYKTTENVVIPVDSNIILGFLRRALLVILFLIFKTEHKFRPIFNILYNISWFSLIFYILFYTIPFLASRAGTYFLIFECISYVTLLKLLNQKYLQHIFLAFIILFSIFLFCKNIAPYPHLFIPYKTIFGIF
ncbi:MULTISPECIES: EpsG family protein [unclassified Chryseobacterium]|uniref:EpsG family protein n=1 Tax=unclassified Chryseobacterium TaxID=2593645 RepID=UPI001BDFF12F|nr:EpsG family protein [Chryseobacterium sp. ZHDP1]